MNEEEIVEKLKRALDETKGENEMLKYRCMEKETYIVGCGGEYAWQKAIKLTKDQAKAIKWFINETDVDYYIQEASEVTEEIE